jgi:hypothetical protein
MIMKLDKSALVLFHLNDVSDFKHELFTNAFRVEEQGVHEESRSHN